MISDKEKEIFELPEKIRKGRNPEEVKCLHCDFVGKVGKFDIVCPKCGDLSLEFSENPRER